MRKLSLKKNAIVALFMALTLVACTVITSATSYAATESSKRAEAQAAKEKAEELNAAAGEVAAEILGIQAEIEVYEQEIAETTEALAAKEKEVEEQNEALNERLVSMYKTGSVGFIDVLLSSNNIEELITNFSMVQRILKSDSEILAGLEEDYEEIEQLKAEQEAAKAEIEASEAELQEKQAELQEEADEQEALSESLNAEADKLAAEALKRQQELEKQQNAGTADKVVNTGSYAWPLPSGAVITSYFGYRIHPIYGDWRYHTGADLAMSSGTPVYAMGNGTVTMASTYGGYGNCIMIYYGNGIQSLYGHLSGYAVSAGQTVTKGQVVGYVGSTGQSTGPHLHFEVLVNGTRVDPFSYYSSSVLYAYTTNYNSSI